MSRRVEMLRAKAKEAIDRNVKIKSGKFELRAK
jgi:hypothetical protein